MKPGLGKETRLPLDHCINCGRRCDAASPVDEVRAKPKSGDVTLCIACGHLMVFGKDLKLREPNALELIAIAGDRRIVRASTALKAMWDAGHRPK